MNEPVSRRALIGGVGGALAVGTLAASPASALGAPLSAPGADGPAPGSGMLLGIGTHVSAQNKGYSVSQLRMLREAGATTIRDEVEWDQVETQPGVYSVSPRQDSYIRAAAAAGLDVMLVLDYSNPFYDNYDRPTSDEAIAAFTRYAVFLAHHFRGVVDRFEIWNEWDIAIGGGNIRTGGTPEDYMRLVRSVYPALKAVNPNLTVVAGAMTNAAMFNGFLDTILEHGLVEYSDAVSLHPYNWGDLPLDQRRPERWIETRVKFAQNKLRRHNGGQDFPIYVTEMSWPTQIDQRGIAPEWAAAYVARSYLLCATLPYLKGYWWHNLQDNSWSHTRSQDNFGLVRVDDSPKPAYYAYASVAALLADGRYEQRLATPDPEVWALRFRTSQNSYGGRHTIALWNAYMDDNYSVVLRDGRGGRGQLAVAEVGTPERRWRWGRREWYSDREAPVIPNEIELTLRRTPVLLRGNLDGVTITRVVHRPFPESQRP